MKLLFAQGNPGSTYDNTRHNVGFAALDALVSRHDATWKKHPKAAALTAEYFVDGTKIVAVKPTSFYNETGGVARALMDFYKLDPSTDILVIHDDLALPLGTIRVRQKGSDAGNNGIKSLNAHIGQSYARLRIGIWNDRRDTMGDSAFVLGRFGKDEQAHLLSNVIPATLSIVDRFIAGSLEDHSLSLPLPSPEA